MSVCVEKHIFNTSIHNALTTVLLQETVYETLHALCQRLPKDQSVSDCDSQVKMHLPKLLQQSPGHLVSSASICSSSYEHLGPHLTRGNMCERRSQERRVWSSDSVLPTRRRNCRNFPKILPTRTYPHLNSAQPPATM